MPAAQQSEHHGQDDSTDHGDQRGDHELVPDVGLVGVADGPGRGPEPMCSRRRGSPPSRSRRRPRRTAPAATRRSGRSAGRGAGGDEAGQAGSLSRSSPSCHGASSVDWAARTRQARRRDRPMTPGSARRPDRSGPGRCTPRRRRVAGLDPDHPHRRWRCADEDRPGRLSRHLGRRRQRRSRVAGDRRFVGRRSGGRPGVRRRRGTGSSARPERGWASSGAAGGSAAATPVPVRSKRLPATITSPGPSQVSRARASSARGRRSRRGGLGGESRSADHHDPASERTRPGWPGRSAT